jgi:hypothetical protein
MRQFTVVGPEKQVNIYEGFDRCPADSDFKIIPDGRVVGVEGTFFCKTKDLPLAIHEAIRYNQEQFGRTSREVTVVPVF